MVWTVAARENERDRGLTNTLVRRVRSFQGRTLETLSVRSPLNYVQGPVNVSQSSLRSIIHNSLSIFATPRILVIKLRNPVGFSYIKNTLKDQLCKTVCSLQFAVWQLALRARKVLGTFENQGPVSRKSRELFGPEKPVVKLWPAYSVKLVFSYVVKGIKIKITAKFRASRRLRFEDTKRIVSPEIRPKSFGTFEKQAPGPCRIALSWMHAALNKRHRVSPKTSRKLDHYLWREIQTIVIISCSPYSTHRAGLGSNPILFWKINSNPNC